MQFLFFRLIKVSGKSDRDLTPYEIEKCKKDTTVYDEQDCFTKALYFVLKIEGEERKYKNRIVEYNLQLHAHNGSGFDTLIKLNKLPFGKRLVDNIKNGESKIKRKVLIGYV